jgi:hypothetical protein
MRLKHILQVLLLIGFLAVSACKGKNIALEGFDDETWRADPQGCKGERAQFWAFFDQNKEVLNGFSESDLKVLLGKPDERELYKRGQWFYIYFFDAGPLCDPTQEKQRGATKRMEIRLSAVGDVSEVILRP